MVENDGYAPTENVPNRAKLTPRQREFVRALLANSVIDAARDLGLPERTARRWAALPAVQTAIAEAQRASLAEATRHTVDAMTGAVDTLQDVMDNARRFPSARVSAARAILENGVRLTETLDLAARVAALEGAHNERHELVE